LKEKEVLIMDDAWIGFNATVLRGVTIGRGAVIGACSVVTENVPDYAIVVGNPARIIGYANKQA
jgi:maltose O-acetyltransferase